MLIRAAQPADVLAVARVHVRAWQVGYRDLLPAEYLDGLRAEDRAERYTFGAVGPQLPATAVAMEGDELCGFVTTLPARDPDVDGHGELAALYVDPDRWGRKIGLALVGAGRASLSERGFQSAVLWVLVGNARAQRFYENDGWVPDGRRRTEEIWGARVYEERYRRQLP